MFIIYDIIFIIFAIIYIPYLTIKGKWHKGFWMRMGFVPEPLRMELGKKQNIWVHAVSVGEVLAVLDLVKGIKNKYPEARIVFSTVTRTGNELAKEKLSKEDIVIYAPLDFSFIVRKFVRIIDPELYVSAETEIWPNLYSALHFAGKKIVQVNGRISDKAYRGYSKIAFLLKGTLKNVDGFCMQSDMDAKRIITLGAHEERVKAVGNIKFDISMSDIKAEKEKYGFKNDDIIFTGGSTHPGEEEILLNAFKKAVKRFPGLRMIIAPRHIERSSEVEGIIERSGFKAVRFSGFKDTKINKDTVLLVDTIGNLRELYSLSRIAFVGKSFCGTGGQNIIEPAYFGNAVLVGPHTENFKDAMNIFLKEKAVIQLKTPDEMSTVLEALLDDPGEITSIGALAREAVFRCQGATGRTLSVINEILSS